VVVLPLVALYEFSIVLSGRVYRQEQKRMEEWS
jgi:Sec-independent protein secretion pathway component TatC